MLVVFVTALAAVFAARLLGPDDFGRLSIITFTVSLLGLLGGLGTSQAVRVLAGQSSDSRLARSYLTLSLGLALVVAVVAVVALVVVFAVSPDLEPDGNWLPLVLVQCFFLLVGRQLAELAMVLISVPNGVLIQATFGASQLVAFGALRALDMVTLEALIASVTLSALVFALSVVILLFARGRLEAPGWYVPEVRQLLAFGLRSLGFSVGLLMVWRLDRVILGLVSGPAAVGAYSVAASLAESGRAFPQGAAQAVLGDVAAEGYMSRRVSRIRLLVPVAMLVGSLVLWVLAPTIVDALFGPAYQPSVTPLRILCFGESVMALVTIDSRVLLGLRQELTVGLIGLAAGLACPAIYFAGARIAGADGTAVASVVIYSGMAAVYAFFIRKGSGVSKSC